VRSVVPFAVAPPTPLVPSRGARAARSATPDAPGAPIRSSRSRSSPSSALELAIGGVFELLPMLPCEGPGGSCLSRARRIEIVVDGAATRAVP